MKKILNILIVLTTIVVLASCGEATVDTTALNAKVEEQAAAQIDKIQADATTNCEARMVTELKAKTDSILAAREAAAGAM